MKITLLTAFAVLTLIGSAALAMPPINGAVEPRYPAGVNQPSQLIHLRDDPALEGEWNCLVVLVDFPDYPWDRQNDSNFANNDRAYTQQHFRDMLFSDRSYRHPGARSQYTGSMRDYYTEISSGAFTVQGVATRWYRAPHPYSYYCNQDGQPGTPDDNGFGDYPNNAQGLVRDILEMADADVNLADFDNDGDGSVEGLFVVHSGPGAEAIPGDAGAGYIWSHKWWFPGYQGDGVSISEYTIEPEDGTIGVFCHEFGHALGLPDLYDTDGSSEGVGEWCLMGSGGWNYRDGDPRGTCPGHMSAWAKDQLDWIQIINIRDEVDNLQINPVESEAAAYSVWTRGEIDNEYFLLENRRRIGFDEGLTRRQMEYNLDTPAGLLIWHIDDGMNGNEDENHRLVDVVEASQVIKDGNPFENLSGARVRPADRNLYFPNRGDNGDLWPGYGQVSNDSTSWTGDRDRDHFGSFTTPSSFGYSGAPSLVDVSNIHFVGEDIFCDVRTSSAPGPQLFFDHIEISDTRAGNHNGFPEPGEEVDLTIFLRNWGDQRATQVTTTCTYDGNLDVHTSPESVRFNDIVAGDAVGAAVPFAVTIPQDAPAVTDLHFNGVASCNDSLSFLYEFTFGLRPPHDWFKNEGNPVLFGADEGWDSGGIVGIATLLENDTLKCWYVGGMIQDSIASVGYAFSIDGGETWQKYADPVLTPPDHGWAVGGFQGLAVYKFDDRYQLMLIGLDSQGLASIGKAVSRDGFNWQLDADPLITDGRWFAELFPFGNLAIIPNNDMYLLAFAGSTQMGTVAMGVAGSQDGLNWQVDVRPTISPTLNQADFDGFVTFSPDVYESQDENYLLYSGITQDFVGRLGIYDIQQGPRFVRHPGHETGGSVLEPDNDGWEAGGIILGGRLFQWNGHLRMLYTVAGDGGAAIGLAVKADELGVPSNPVSDAQLPNSLTLDSAYPNPFNSTTTIRYHLNSQAPVEIALFDLRGRSVMRQNLGMQKTGYHRFTLDTNRLASPISSGFYFIRVKSPLGSAARGVLLLK